MKDTRQLLTIGALAQRTGVSTSALRFYEARGLLHAERTAVSHRRYPRAITRRVAFIVFAQRVGLTLEEIRAELNRLPSERVPMAEDWERLTQLWRGLTDCIGCGCLSLERCAVLNADDHLASEGSGPRSWVGAPHSCED